MERPGNNNTRSNFLLAAVSAFVAFWILLAIRPLNRGDWLLENLLIFVSVAVLGATFRRFRFSSISYALILIFLALHTIGAHYTYAQVPAGFWMQHWFNLSRNHYDRAIHFGFGLILLYPMRELLMRSAQADARWGTWLAVISLCALSSVFEVIEGVVAQIVAPELGAAYLGTQGDMWDAQQDMACAFFGALLAALLTLLINVRARTMS